MPLATSDPGLAELGTGLHRQEQSVDIHPMRIIAWIGTLLLANALSAAITVKVYRKAIASRSQSEEMRAYVAGIGTGLLIANDIMFERGSKPLFCAPKLTIREDNYIDILNEQIKTSAGQFAGKDLEGAHIEFLLLHGLSVTFACNKK
jgi:hypothetical protein